MAVTGIDKNIEIPRIPECSVDSFIENYFLRAKPVIITGAMETWPCRNWTIEQLMERSGSNEVWIRGKTNQADYRVGKTYNIRKDTFGNYCSDLLKGNAKARSSYLAVASMQTAFPDLYTDVRLPKYINEAGKIHLGPYMWVALKGHYEFCHFDPDDNFLMMIQGRKRVRLFGHDIENMYPNPLGSHGKTIQSRVDVDDPDFIRFPKFASVTCQHCVLNPGEMLFIPAFYWHQVSALDTGISINAFYGDSGVDKYFKKIQKSPYKEHFEFWIKNIITQNSKYESFSRMLPRLNQVLYNFFTKQWHETPDQKDLEAVTHKIMDYCKTLNDRFSISTLNDDSKFPPVLKIRGLLYRDGNKTR